MIKWILGKKGDGEKGVYIEEMTKKASGYCFVRPAEWESLHGREEIGRSEDFS